MTAAMDGQRFRQSPVNKSEKFGDPMKMQIGQQAFGGGSSYQEQALPKASRRLVEAGKGMI